MSEGTYKMKLESLNGNLFSFLTHLSYIRKYAESPCISDRIELSDAITAIGKVIKDCRANGYDWIFSNNDIYKDDDDYRLPSVSLPEYFDLEDFFQKRKNQYNRN